MNPPKNILVLGGTGYVGQAVCEHRAERSGGAGRLLVPTRRLAHGRHLRCLPTLELVEGSVHDDAFLDRVMAGQDAVVNLVAILHGDERGFEQAHVELPRRLAAACARHGVRRLVHVSALGVAEDGPSMYLRSKARGEAVLKAAGLDLTILRPSVIFGAGDRFLNTFAALQALAPVMPLGHGDARFQPVWIDDVARAVGRCLDDRGTIGRTYQCAGPDEFTLSQLVRLAGRWSGHERPQIPLPAPLAWLQALVLEHLPGPTLMSRDNIGSMQVPNVADPALPGLAELGIAPMAMDAVAPGWLSGRDSRRRFDLLRTGARRP